MTYLVHGTMHIHDVEISEQCAKEIFKRVFKETLMTPLKKEFPDIRVEVNIITKMIESVEWKDYDYQRREDIEKRSVLREMTDEEVEQWKLYFKLTNRIYS